MSAIILNRFHRDNCTLRSSIHGSTTSATSVIILKAAIARKSARCKETTVNTFVTRYSKLSNIRLTWLMHLSEELHSHGVGREHRKAKARIDPTAHAAITPINVQFAHENRRDVIVLLKSSPNESLLNAMVMMRRICATYSCYKRDQFVFIGR